jgi:tRNA A-37 threonylcarbamoyl transferase component Bud32
LALVPGSNAGPYRIVEPLGRGGMASVYRAYEPKLDRYVALKVLPREFLHDPTFAERFRREAQVVARLEHPNIIPIYAYDIEEQDGIPWMAMRLITSGSLGELIRRERLPLARSVAILRGVADALDYAHGKGIVHRDVKPQNVLLDEASRVYLADFGIAKILESAGGLTASGMITGTPQYMAPEQATGLKIGPPADVYALGIVAYEMFTGKVPFAADTPVAVLMKHVQEPLPLPPPDVVPEPLLRALLKATTKKPEDRWSSAGAFVEALSAGLGGYASARTAAPTVAIPPTPPPLAPPTIVSPAPAPPAPGTAPPLPPRPPVMRPPAARNDAGAARRPPSRSGLLLLGLGAIGLVLVVGVGALGLWLWGGRAQEPAPPTPRPREAPAQETPRPSSARANPATAGTAAPRPSAERETVPAVPAATPRPSATPAATPRPTPTPPPAVVTPVPVSTPTPAPATPAVDPELERLTAELGDRDAATRRRAAQELAARGPLAAQAVPALVVALSDRSPDVRLRAAEALGRIGPAAAAGSMALAGALRDTDALVPAEAAKALGLLGDAAAPAASALGSALSHRDVAVRREAARALARMGRRAEPALAPLVTALSDKDKTVCAQAARALGRLGAAARPAVPRLTALSKDPDVLVSREAQGALESIGREQP